MTFFGFLTGDPSLTCIWNTEYGCTQESILSLEDKFILFVFLVTWTAWLLVTCSTGM